jgi:hypothetical protein
MRLARLVPPDLCHQLDHVRSQNHALEGDIADLHDGTGCWARTDAGMAARAVREAALERQRAQQSLENQDLGRWSRHKARRALVAAGDRFDKALVAWENSAGPYATRLEAGRGRLGAEVGSSRLGPPGRTSSHGIPRSRAASLNWTWPSSTLRRTTAGADGNCSRSASTPADSTFLTISTVATGSNCDGSNWHGAGPSGAWAVFPSENRARHELGAFRPPGRGADQQCPVGARPPVKSLTLGLHHPGFGRARAILGAGNLTGSVYWLTKKQHICGKDCTVKPHASVVGIIRSYYVRLDVGSEQP